MVTGAAIGVVASVETGFVLVKDSTAVRTIDVEAVIAGLAERCLRVSSVVLSPDTSTAAGTEEGPAFQAVRAKLGAVEASQLGKRERLAAGFTGFVGFHDIPPYSKIAWSRCSRLVHRDNISLKCTALTD